MSAHVRRIGPIRRLSLGPESERADREFWAALSEEQRIEAVWRLTTELWTLKGWSEREPGLLRTAVRAFRR